MKKFLLCLAILSLASLSGFILCCQRAGRGLGQGQKRLQVEVRVNPHRAKVGETVSVEAVVQSTKTSVRPHVEASLLVPSKGVRDLLLKPGGREEKGKSAFLGEIPVGADFPEGLYVITVVASAGSQTAAGKGSFFLGRIVGDFMIVSAFPGQDLEEDLRRYYEDFKSVGGNMVTIHNIISGKALYPSLICVEAAESGSQDDRVGPALRLAKEYGLASFISVSWDMTRPMPYSECLASTKEVMADLWKLYQTEPALAGFYSYQEGSGTYLASQLREFSAAAKALNRGLLTSCAPYLDDPLLAGYLAAIDDLDIVIYQGAVMASYRKDNRKCFPLRRTKDFTSLSAGATRQRNKITLSHVELFGYLEKQFAGAYLASREDIYSQILSAATSNGPDGIVFFTYHYNIHELGKKIPEVKESRRGVEEGMRAYSLISGTAATRSSRMGVYIPYSDWWVERWTNSIVPSLDAFRQLGISPEILPFLPPKGEDVLPYYPYHLNREQLDFLLRNKYVLVLNDIAGMQDTDSLLLKSFIEKGGVVLLFGPSIPYGDQFDRETLCGARENPAGSHSRMAVQEAIGPRTGKGSPMGFRSVKVASWSPGSARIIASFEDGSGAVLANELGKGLCLTVSLSLKEMVEFAPDFLRDVLDFALARQGAERAFDVLGSREELDLAESTSSGRRHLAVVNHRDEPWAVTILPLHLPPGLLFELREERTGTVLRRGRKEDFSGLKLVIPGRDYILLNLSEQ